MTTPVVQSVQYDNAGLLVYIIFDRAVLASDLDGFTFTVDSCTSISPTFASVDENAVIGTLSGVISGTLVVDYSGGGSVQEAVAPNDPAAAFSDETAVPYPDPSTVYRAQAGVSANDAVTVFFNQPVGAVGGDLVAGFTIEVDDVAIDLSSATATLNDDQTELTIDTGTNFSYNSVVDVIYDDDTGSLYTWDDGDVSDFTIEDVINGSTDGLPTSGYPLSVITMPAIEISGNQVTAKLEIALNPIDRQLVSRYGPLTVITGGTFGTEPNDITVLGASVNVVDGRVISQAFTATDVNDAVLAAQEWQDVVATKIGNELGVYRTTDQGIVFGSGSITQV